MEYSSSLKSSDSKVKASKHNSFWDDHHDKNHQQPYFDNATATNVTSQLGKTAYLTCRVKQLGDRTDCSN
uniref:Ig-like domain-containing protein n=1 Tax=Strigamia maritima TaxID=126957 RepID=T1J777_STRMM